MAKKKKDAPVEAPEAVIADNLNTETEAAEKSPDTVVEQGNSPHNELEEKLKEAEEKAAENWDKVLRAEAELQNAKRRATQAQQEARQYGIEKFAEEMLLVLDSLEQGLQAAKEQEEVPAAWLEGMELTYKMLLGSLEKFQVVMVDPEGEPFDPKRHEAMTLQPTDSMPPNHVCAVLQKGFSIHERTLRPAKVIVSKALPEAEKSA